MLVLRSHCPEEVSTGVGRRVAATRFVSRSGAGQIDDWRAGLATQLEMLRDEVRQGHQAIIERLARIEATQDEPNNLKRKNSGETFEIRVARLLH